ncbi:hypothetical protein [Amaricoccus solimangrovi]|uniref:hypothetical protein n=1 Tax=Amaricoccus solimangrovi TaxID=2589815 RepID=UPI0015E2B7F9|nr:hypothetical protein [Amaricoccus solimangrovi]
MREPEENRLGAEARRRRAWPTKADPRPERAALGAARPPRSEEEAFAEALLRAAWEE